MLFETARMYTMNHLMYKQNSASGKKICLSFFFSFEVWDHNLSHDSIRRVSRHNAANVERSEG